MFLCFSKMIFYDKDVHGLEDEFNYNREMSLSMQRKKSFIVLEIKSDDVSIDNELEIPIRMESFLLKFS